MIFANSPFAAAMNEGTASTIMSFLPIVALVVIFYFLLIRPQQKREKKVKEMLAAIKPGDRITTIGGIFARVLEVNDDVLVIEVGSDKTKMMIARWAVRNVEDVDADNEMQQD